MPLLRSAVGDVPEVRGRPHVMRANRASQRPRSLLFLDTETAVAYREPRIEWHRFRLGVTCYVRRRGGVVPDTEVWGRYETPESLCVEIERRAYPKQPLYVFASNPNFDLWVLGLYWRFAIQGWRAAFCYHEGLRYILVIRRGDQSVKVLALQNFWPVSIAQVGATLGLPKLDVDPLTATESDVWRYCKRDVEILRAAILAYITFCDTNDVGGWALTQSGQAHAAYRHRFLKHRLWVHREPEVLALERQGYFGGRTECGRIGECKDGPYAVLDVNSLYPYVMRRYPYPISFRWLWKYPHPDLIRRTLRRHCVIADVTLSTDRPLWAVRSGGKTIFPVGEFRTGVCTAGLIIALELGAVKAVHEMAVYRRAHIFTDYVETFYGLRNRYREAGEPVWSELCKYMLNKLYGKFGQADPITEYEETTDNPGYMRERYIPLDGSGAMMITQLMGRVWGQRGRHENKESMPAVAAHVTEYGRMTLARYRHRAGWDGVVYMDTDSLILPEQGIYRLRGIVHPTRLGALSLEGVIQRLHIWGPKDYEKDGQRVIKGVSKNARLLSPGVFAMELFPGLKSLLRDYGLADQTHLPGFRVSSRDLLEAQRIGLYPIITHTKTLQRKYDKGQVLPDGSVVPLVV